MGITSLISLQPAECYVRFLSDKDLRKWMGESFSGAKRMSTTVPAAQAKTLLIAADNDALPSWFLDAIDGGGAEICGDHIHVDAPAGGLDASGTDWIVLDNGQLRVLDDATYHSLILGC